MGDSGVDSYPITPTMPNVPNYDISVVPGTLRVMPAPLDIRAEDKTKTYGDPDPTFTTVIHGLVNQDDRADLTGLSVSGPPTGSHAGAYPITVSGVTNPNYTVTYQQGAEQITPPTWSSRWTTSPCPSVALLPTRGRATAGRTATATRA